jgi:hypothetical protein
VNSLNHRRLRNWEPFDEISLRIIPRYKTSGLSGDEWRQHVQIEFKHKGEVVFSAGAGDMQSAYMMLGHHMLEQACPIPDRVIEIERDACDQPSCKEKAVGRYMLKRLTADNGEFLDMKEQYSTYYRQFCKKHARRGDCSREDADDNYEPLDGLKPEASSNIHESPSGFGGAFVIDGPWEEKVES